MKFKVGDKVRCIDTNLTSTRRKCDIIGGMDRLMEQSGSDTLFTVDFVKEDGSWIRLKEDKQRCIWHPDDFTLAISETSDYHLAKAIWHYGDEVIPVTLYQKSSLWYLIQNNHDGSVPSEDPKAEWKKYGKFGWIMPNGWHPSQSTQEQAKHKEGFVTDIIKLNNPKEEKGFKKTMSNLMAKLKKLTRKEPEKSFVDQGVTSEDGQLTSEGRDAFVQFLFDDADNRTAFYNAVVEPIAKAEKDNK